MRCELRAVCPSIKKVPYYPHCVIGFLSPQFTQREERGSALSVRKTKYSTVLYNTNTR